MDSSGYAHASLTPREDLLAAAPALRPMTLLTLAEMGGAHAGHGSHETDKAQTVETQDVTADSGVAHRS
jgi:hypothetical protein